MAAIIKVTGNVIPAESHVMVLAVSFLRLAHGAHIRSELKEDQYHPCLSTFFTLSWSSFDCEGVFASLAH